MGQGDRGAGDVGFAGLGGEGGVEGGVAGRLVAPESFRASLGAKGRSAQLATWKWARGWPGRPGRR